MKFNNKFLIFLFLFIFSLDISYCAKKSTPSIDTLSTSQLKSRIKNDINALLRYERGLKRTIDFAKKHRNIFPVKKWKQKKMFSPSEKEILLDIWQSLLDYSYAVESVHRYYLDYHDLSDKEMQKSSFVIFYAAFLIQYRNMLEFIALAENNPSIDIFLNEKNRDLNIKKNTYSQYKSATLNVAIASKFIALNTIYSIWARKHEKKLRKSISVNKKFIWKMGKGKGEKLTLKNALTILKKTGSKAFFPVQTGVSEWMGDTKVWRISSFLITDEQIKDIHLLLKPGDILLERREWYLSNIGLPGYWPHAALYIGTPEEREKFFTGDEEIVQWVQSKGIADGDFELLLKKKYPKKYADSLKSLEENHIPRIIEAMSEGVCFTTLEHSAASDSLAVLRPRLSKKEVGRAIIQAFKYKGRPYDFNFDFLTDNELVCTELIYKVYQPSKEFKGLNIPVIKIMGRLATPANEIVKQFDKNFRTESQQMDFILFYDGYERARKAVPSNIKAFRKSWKRPKWHIFTQK